MPNPKVIIVGSWGEDPHLHLELLKEHKEIILVNSINDLPKEEESMLNDFHCRPRNEEMLYDLFDIDQFLKDPKPLKVKTKIKKDSLYKKGGKACRKNSIRY